MKKNKLFTIILILVFSITTMAQNIQGYVTELDTKEPLIGVTVSIKGTVFGSITDLDGKFNIDCSNVKTKDVILEVRYMSFKTIQTEPLKLENLKPLNFQMQRESFGMQEVVVVARKNLENAATLLRQRKISSLAIENIGAKEMSLKGISNVQEGVKKMTGISVSDHGQIVVRGMGDRYSMTTLNGLPIASPNPDKKLIPLDLFPSNIVKNITVSKVYDARVFADYSGAHIDIATKEKVGKDFFNISVNIGGNTSTTFSSFYEMKRENSLFRNEKINSNLKNTKVITTPGDPYQWDKSSEKYIKTHKNTFTEDFGTDRTSALPRLSGNVAFGKGWDFGNNRKLNALAYVGIAQEALSINNAFDAKFSSHDTLNYFKYNSYENSLKIGGLACLGYSFNANNTLNYTLFYSRNAQNEFLYRDGYTLDHVMISNADILHIFSLMNNQLMGSHKFEKGKFGINWGVGYSSSLSDEPDRREVLFSRQGDGFRFFTGNQNATNRYFGELSEKGVFSSLDLSYYFGNKNHFTLGFGSQNKDRNSYSTIIYYNFDIAERLPVFESMYDNDVYFNYYNVQAEKIKIHHDSQNRYIYDANQSIYASYLDFLYNVNDKLQVNPGVRLEKAKQYVNYTNEQGIASKSTINKLDYFAALNIKYDIDKNNDLRFSVSKTITRPSFVEMSPFLYKPGFGMTQIIGNADIHNAYNYNFDLRYEFMNDKTKDLFSVTAYYKDLEEPIEQIQYKSGNDTRYSFRNANNGVCAGLEFEMKKKILKSLFASANYSYMYTDVNLPNGGDYTENNRALQGASPYLFNADLTYSPEIGDYSSLALTILYNLQGPRISAVGVNGLGDIKQQSLSNLNFVCKYKLNSNLTFSAQCKNILNNSIEYKQKLYNEIAGKSISSTKTTKKFKTGVNISLGMTYVF